MSSYYLFEQSGGVQMLLSDNPKPHWARVPPDDVNRVLSAMADGRPMRMMGKELQVGEVRPSLDPMSWDWDAKAWADTRTNADREREVKAQRQQMLVTSDWTQLPDVPQATKTAWATYRQALRDITVQSGYPVDVVWPVTPG